MIGLFGQENSALTFDMRSIIRFEQDLSENGAIIRFSGAIGMDLETFLRDMAPD